MVILVLFGIDSFFVFVGLLISLLFVLLVHLTDHRCSDILLVEPVCLLVELLVVVEVVVYGVAKEGRDLLWVCREGLVLWGKCRGMVGQGVELGKTITDWVLYPSVVGDVVDRGLMLRLRLVGVLLVVRVDLVDVVLGC